MPHSPVPGSDGAFSRRAAEKPLRLGRGSRHFPLAVYVGDTVTCTVTITEKDELERKIRAVAIAVNQNSMEVLRARFAGFPADVRLAR
jgi:acyl dehydratase